MLHIIVSSIGLSIIHALIPNHWIPLLAIGKAENWTWSTTLWSTTIAGLAHVSSTIIIGIAVGWVGYKFSSNYQWLFDWIAPGIIVALGVWYIIKNQLEKNCHEHVHHHHDPLAKVPNSSNMSIVLSLCVGMFFSPCIELETYYFTAGTFGWHGILAVSLVYLIVTTSTMVLLVYLALLGVNKLKFHVLEHHEHTIVGATLILVGLISFFIHF